MYFLTSLEANSFDLGVNSLSFSGLKNLRMSDISLPISNTTINNTIN